VLLAAGASERMMGLNKLLVPIAGEPAIARVCSAMLQTELDPVMIILGYERAEVVAALASLKDTHASKLRFVVNGDFREGRVSSIRAAIRSLPAECCAAMFLRGDQPWIAKGLITDLLDAFRKKKAPLAFPVYEGRKGSPTVFCRSLFDRLLALKGDRGTLDLVEEFWGVALKMQVEDPRCLMGVDTREDLDRLLL
jgi:molybdenum cofactor cytidylyltransferase